MGCSSYLLRAGARDSWEEVGYSLEFEAVAAMSWADFVSSFRVEFIPAIEV